MIRSPLVQMILFVAWQLIAVTPWLHAQPSGTDPSDQIADSAPLDGYDRIGIYGGGNAIYNAINEEALPKITEHSYSPAGPSGMGFAAGIVYARLLPNFFITKPPSDDDRADPERLYRKLTTFELRLLYSRFEGSSTQHDYYPIRNNTERLYVEQQVTSLVEMITLEPQLLLDLQPMRNSTGGFMSLGTSLGYITNASFRSRVVPAEPVTGDVPLPSSGDEPYDMRRFYAALLLGGGVRIGLGGDIRKAPALLPSINLIVPLTTIGRQSRWLPIGFRFGMSLHWPL